MKKLILTLFLASASLVSFAQSTVKTIRVTNATTLMTVNLPLGTLVIDVAKKNIYVATAGVSLLGDDGDAFSITSGLAEAEPLFKRINDSSIYSVTDEFMITALSNSTITVSPTQTPDGAAVAIVASDFKVYVNGTLLLKSAYTYSEGSVIITANIYEFDQIALVYNTIK
jgi:hypothetical protein